VSHIDRRRMSGSPKAISSPLVSIDKRASVYRTDQLSDGLKLAGRGFWEVTYNADSFQGLPKSLQST
jgi:hypothetical protein